MMPLVTKTVHLWNGRQACKLCIVCRKNEENPMKARRCTGWEHVLIASRELQAGQTGQAFCRYCRPKD